MGTGSIPAIQTPKGKRSDIAIYWYKDNGHGYVTGGKSSNVNNPFHDKASFMELISSLYDEHMS